MKELTNKSDMIVDTIYVSATTNDNWVHFSSEKLVEKYKTAIGQYLDYEHFKDLKIGMILDAYPISDLNLRTKDFKNPQHILARLIIWDDTLRETFGDDKASDIRRGIVTKKYGTSMELTAEECRLRVFAEDGSISYLPINEDTYFIYALIRGGFFGILQSAGIKVDIDMVDFSFTGDAITENPANKDSVILGVIEADQIMKSSEIVKNDETEIFEFNKSVEHKETNEMEKELKDMQEKLAALTSELEAKKTELQANATAIADLNKQVGSLTAEKTTLTSELEAAKKACGEKDEKAKGMKASSEEQDKKIAELQASITASAKKADDLESTVAKYQKAETLAKRKEMLASKLCNPLTDEVIMTFEASAFEAMVSALPVKPAPAADGGIAFEANKDGKNALPGKKENTDESKDVDDIVSMIL